MAGSQDRSVAKLQAVVAAAVAAMGSSGCYPSLPLARPEAPVVPLSRLDFAQTISVALYPSAVSSVCEWPQHEHGPRVRKREAR